MTNIKSLKTIVADQIMTPPLREQHIHGIIFIRLRVLGHFTCRKLTADATLSIGRLFR